MHKILIKNCQFAVSPISGDPLLCDVYVLVDDHGRMLWHENLFLARIATQESLNSIRSYASDLLSFAKMALPIGGWLSITPTKMLGYIRGELVQSRRYASSTLARHIETIKAFYEWLVIKGYLADMPDFDWSYKHLYRNDQPDKTTYHYQQHSHHSLYLDRTTFESILAGIQSADRFIQLRDAIVLLLGHECGLRAHEIHNLYTSDIRKKINEARDKNDGLWATTRIKLLGKGARAREIFLPPRLSEIISIYIVNFRSKLKNKDGALICRKDGLPLSDIKHASSVFTRACHAAKIPRKHRQGYHRLRKCFGTNLVQECWNAGRDPWVEVPRRLGHKNIETTKKYIQFEALLNCRSDVLSNLRMHDAKYTAIQLQKKNRE